MGKPVSKKSKVEFAEMLKAWRERNNYTQVEAAKQLRLSIHTLRNWEVARTKPQGIAYTLLTEIILKK